MLELAATRVVPTRSQKSAGPPTPRPAVSHMLATTVASTMRAILGRTSRETSAAMAAAVPARSRPNASLFRDESDACSDPGTVAGANAAAVKSDAKSGGGVMRKPFHARGQSAVA